MTTMIKLANLEKRFGAAVVLEGLNLSIGDSETYVLLGPSGCGKTTTLRMVAGLETPSAGEISLGNTIVYSGASRISLSPEQRPIGMVFQSYALWPTMTVAEHIMFTLRHGRQRLNKAEASARVIGVLDMMQLSALADRKVTQLSGGQQQRVAFARAIAQRPRVLLMDEPLSNLDPQLRADVRGEFRQMTTRLGITSIIVTHDRDDATALADRVGVMNHGKIIQDASPSDIITRPISLFVAQLFSEMNAYEATIEETSKGMCKVTIAGMHLNIPTKKPLRQGSAVTLAVRSSSQRFGDKGLPGTVVECHREGDQHRSRVEVAGSMVTIYHKGQPARIGEQVRIQSDLNDWIIFESPDT